MMQLVEGAWTGNLELGHGKGEDCGNDVVNGLIPLESQQFSAVLIIGDSSE
jgi:hypothetical protein